MHPPITIILCSGAGSAKKEDQQKVNLLLNETTDGDYLLAIEKVGEVLQSAYINAEFTADVYLVFGDISQTDKNMDIILRSIKAANLNVRNQQMYYTVLQQIKKNLMTRVNLLINRIVYRTKYRNVLPL